MFIIGNPALTITRINVWGHLVVVFVNLSEETGVVTVTLIDASNIVQGIQTCKFCKINLLFCIYCSNL